MKHWSQQVSEVTLSFSSHSVCPIPISGGSENGQFCLVGDSLKHDRLIYHSGSPKLQAGAVFLEVQGERVAGFTQKDLADLLLQVGQNATPVLIKVAKAGCLGKDLRSYLDSRFRKGSVDHDTQVTIRDNLYKRTVPCTTRQPRNGEVNGIDYTFVSLEEFQELERSGSLIESGLFDGNYYGTPRPAKLEANAASNSQRSDIMPGAHPSSKGKRERNRSTIEATTKRAQSPAVDRTVSPAKQLEAEPPRIKLQPPPGSPKRDNSQKSMADPTPLPPNWETAYTAEGHMYFIDRSSRSTYLVDSKLGALMTDQGIIPSNPVMMNQGSARHVPASTNKLPVHNTETTHWLDPRIANKTDSDADLPYGWEKVEDPHYGTYYIDHLNRKTQYDRPIMSSGGSMGPGVLHSPAPSAKSLPASEREPDSVSQLHTKPFFTKNPAELSGERLTTTLLKSPRGFGFTIVGGEERDEEFLQIKNVVPNGPAHQDGVLATGDVLVRVNAHLVLGYTHSDVVSMFQSIKAGEKVNLEVCRGYPLAFDPNDPNTEIVTTVAVNMPKLTPSEAKKREADRAERGLDEDDDNSSLDEFANSLVQDLSLKEGLPHSPNQSTVLSPSSGHMSSIEIVRGSNGFGFTIADSATGQRVKHILDRGRCKTLQEGDILIKIDHRDVRGMDHMEVVNVLKSCPIGRSTEIVVQRGGAKKVPRPGKVEQPLDDDEEEESDKESDGQPEVMTSGPAFGFPNRKLNDEAKNKPHEGMFKWKVNSSNPRSPQHLPQTQGKEEDSDGHVTPPPLPSKGRLNSDTTGDSKENVAVLPSKPDTTLPTKEPRLSTDNMKDEKSVSRANAKMEASYKTNNVLSSQHPVMNQYTQFHQHQMPRESLYDIPSKYRPDGGLSSAQRFDLLAPPTRSEPQKPHEFGKPLDAVSRNHPQVLPSFPSSEVNLESRRSRTPGPEMTRSFPEAAPSDRFRSKTPNPSDHKTRAPTQPEPVTTVAAGPAHAAVRGTSFEHEIPSPASPSGSTMWREQSVYADIVLRRGEQGFGFRIVGGPEEGTQVAIGYIVPEGEADKDSRLKTGDEIVSVNGIPTVGESHHKVVSLMGQAASNGQVNLGIRRRVLVQESGIERTPNSYATYDVHSYDVVVERREHEGFGFIIVSSVNKVGAIIGRIIGNSPAERCGRLNVGDKIVSVNGEDVSRMLHEDIVTRIKDSGYTVKLTIAPATPSNSSVERLNGSMVSATALPALGASETLLKNMQSHTTSSTADRYSNYPSKPIGKLNPTAANLGTSPNINPVQVGDQVAYTATQNIRSPPTVLYNGNGIPSAQPSSDLRARVAVNSSLASATNANVLKPEELQTIELVRGSRGFGFSIRGGREFNNMPLYVLRIAEDGAAHVDKRLKVGDEILEINGQETQGMSHADAINLIQSGGSKVHLLIRRSNNPPIDTSMPSPQGSGMSSPAIRGGTTTNSAYPSTQHDRSYDANRIERYNATDQKFATRPPRPFDPQPPYKMPDKGSSYPEQQHNGLPTVLGTDNYQRGYTPSRDTAVVDQRQSYPVHGEHYQRGYSDQRPPTSRQSELSSHPSARLAGAMNNHSSDSRQGPSSYGPGVVASQPAGRNTVSSPYPSNPVHSASSPYSSYKQASAPYQATGDPYQSAGAAYQSAGAPYQSAGAPYQSAGAPYQSAGAPYQSAGPPYKTAGTTYQPAVALNQPSTGSASYLPAGAPYQSALPDGHGSYNAGAMNRQYGQQMYAGYNKDKPSQPQVYDRQSQAFERPPQAYERQPPVGQNAGERQYNYNNYGNSTPAAPYKTLDFGPHGIVNYSVSVPGKLPNGSVRPLSANPPDGSSYYNRQGIYP